MSKITVVAIEPCNGKHPGDRWECSEAEAQELKAAGLVKMAAAPANKMAPGPSANKAHPTVTAGQDAPQSASPAAPASPARTVLSLPRGRQQAPRRGK